MSLTEKQLEKFWDAMAQRFSKRWFDEYGLKPTKAWRELLNRYTPDEIAKALELMHGKGMDHPPTEPRFAGFLIDASAALAKPTQDWMRAYWRSSVVAAFERLGPLCDSDLWPRGRDLRLLRGEFRQQVMHAARRILDDACERERVIGQRLDSHLDQVTREVWEALRVIKADQRAAA